MYTTCKGNKGKSKSNGKQKDTSFLNIDDSQLDGVQTGTELCPLHHIRQCLKRTRVLEHAPIPSQHYVPTGK